MLKKYRTTLFLSVFLFSLFLLRMTLAYHADFWCDEFGWVGFTSGNFFQTLSKFRAEAGPHGIFDPIFLFLTSKSLLKLGIDPNLSFRFFPVLMSLGTSATIFLFKTFSKKEKILWVTVSALHTATNWSALSARPYSSLLFFSSLFFLAGLSFLRGNESAFVKSKLKTLASLLGATCHPYLVFPFAFLSASALFVTRKRKQIWIGIFTWLTLFFLWFFVLKTSTANTSKPLSLVSWLGALSHLDFVFIFNEILHSQSGIMASAKLGSLCFIFYLSLLAVKNRTTELLFVLCGLLLGLILPVALCVKYEMTFTPRYTLSAWPFWNWGFVFTCATLFEVRFQKKQIHFISKAFVLALLTRNLFFPFVHFLQNTPPFYSTPRYHLKNSFKQYEDKKIIVLSNCMIGLGHYYADTKAFDHYFKAHAQSLNPELPKSEKIVVWSRNESSCFGLIPEKPDTQETLNLIQENPGAYVLFSPYNMKVPKLLNKLSCFNEMGGECLK